MKKIQIQYPDPQMEELRRTARRLDRPVSEIVREATAEWLRRRAPRFEGVREEPPVYSAGAIAVDADRLRAASYRNE
ncbi:MAG: ribbon-helix-helix protein, CopG family [Spirochaetales bacterium]|nr:ribbon-helix-helix protein, CopG family [Spirochaetales bacterium]